MVVRWIAGSLRAEGLFEDPLRSGQERAYSGGQRATLQMSCRGQSTERRVQVSGSVTRMPRSASSYAPGEAQTGWLMIDTQGKNAPRIWNVVVTCGCISMSMLPSIPSPPIRVFNCSRWKLISRIRDGIEFFKVNDPFAVHSIKLDYPFEIMLHFDKGEGLSAWTNFRSTIQLKRTYLNN